MSLEGVFGVPDSTVGSGPPMDLWPDLESDVCKINTDQSRHKPVKWNSQPGIPHGIPQQMFLKPNHHAAAPHHGVGQLTSLVQNARTPVPAQSMYYPVYQQWAQCNIPVQMTAPAPQPVFVNRDAFAGRQIITNQYAQNMIPSVPTPVYNQVHSTWHHPQIHGAPVPSARINQSFPNNQDRLTQAYQSLVKQATEEDQTKVQITITQTPNRVVRKIAKRKRYRTAFTTDQVLALEEVFKNQTYINKNERQVLTERLKISERAIKVWFQNRRMKGKRESQPGYEYSDEYETAQEQDDSYLAPSSSADSNSSGSPNGDLDYIESQLSMTDENGYVKLDDKALGSLLNVINPLIPNNINLESTQEIVPKDTNKVIYEPISPAESISSAAEDIDSLEPPKDEEEKRKLFKIHFC